ncbi:MAG: GerMN domain-containing protein [Lachnospiraceae bacterium]|nr:GerMN domain-containing protein [Lachnospiraceae bacterium]
MKKIVNLILVCLMLSVFSACDGAKEAPADEGFRLFYINSQATILTEYSYKARETETLAVVKELFDSMAKVSIEGCSSVVPAGVKYMGAELNGDILNLFISGDLNSAPVRQKMLFCAAMTNSFAQLDDIEGLQIYCDGDPVTDGTGAGIGILKTMRFISDVIDGPDDYKESDLTVYFANEAKDRLVKTVVTAAYRRTTPMERVVVEQIIKGPADKTLSATVPSTLTLLGVNVRDGICYVNFDDKFLTEALTTNDYIPVYSIVNSLLELKGIESVQISINGSSDITMPLGEISFSRPLTYNDVYIDQ